MPAFSTSRPPTRSGTDFTFRRVCDEVPSKFMRVLASKGERVAQQAPVPGAYSPSLRASESSVLEQL